MTPSIEPCDHVAAAGDPRRCVIDQIVVATDRRVMRLRTRTAPAQQASVAIARQLIGDRRREFANRMHRGRMRGEATPGPIVTGQRAR